MYRNIFGIIPAILYLAYERQLTLRLSDYRIDKWRLAVVRGLLVAIAQLLLYTALMQLELATVSALGQTIATFVVLLAIILYSEKIGVWRWSAVIIGFVGAFMIIRPGSDVFTWQALLPVGAAFCYAASTVTLRSFDKDKNLKAALGEEFSSAYLKLKQNEWNSYMAHLTEWEKDNTLDI